MSDFGQPFMRPFSIRYITYICSTLMNMHMHMHTIDDDDDSAQIDRDPLRYFLRGGGSMMDPSSPPATSPSTPSTPLLTMAKDDLSVLFSQMERAVAALEPSPRSSPVRLHDQRHRHDSDDDMEQEEERLHDSSEKLRSLMMMRRGAGQRYDEHQSRSSSLHPNADVPRKLIFETADATSASLCPTSALHIDVSLSSSSPSSPSSSPGYATPLHCALTTAPFLSLSPTRDGTTSISSSTPPQLQYWDCDDHQGEGTPMSPTRTAGVTTPLAFNTPGKESINTEDDEEVENWALCRAPSAFPLRGEEDVEFVGDNVAVERRAGGDGNINSADIIRVQASSSIASSLAFIIESLPPAPSTRARSFWGEEDKDMHEVGCASRCLSELSIQQRFFGLRGVVSGKCNDKSSSSFSNNLLFTSALCRHLAFVALRPDVPCGDIIDLVAEVLGEQGLMLRQRQGSHIVAEIKVLEKERRERSSISENGNQAEWRSVDIQVALDRLDKERVLLVRFIISSEKEEGDCDTGCRKIMTPSRGRRSSVGGVGGGSDGQGTLLEALKAKLFGAGVNKRALLRGTDANSSSINSSSTSKSLKLDPQYLNQLEDLAREDMHRTLEGTARNLEEYVCAAEEKSEQLRLLMEPMYLHYKLESPPSIAKPLPLSFYPLDLLAAGGTMGGELISPEEKTVCGDRLPYIDALKEAAWKCCLIQCDAEMTARMQRKNLQVLDRMAKCTEYQTLLIANLRDNQRRTSMPLFHAFKNQIGHDGGIYDDEDVETPLHYCRCIIGSRPATLFVTYEHLVFVSRVPGFGWSRRIRFDEISTCGLASLRLGITVVKAIAIQAPTATVVSPMPVKRTGGASGTAAPGSSSSSTRASAAVAPRKAEEESLVFSTLIEPERLLDLIKLLITLNDGNIKDAASVGSALPSEEGQEKTQEQASSNLTRELEAASPILVN